MDFENSIWRYYHDSSQDKSKGHIPIPLDDKLWPESWKHISYKTYDRLPTVDLPDPNPIDESLSATLRNRVSSRDFDCSPIALSKLSDMLHASCSVKEGTQYRQYPSGGARYPVEVYVINLQNTEEFNEGVYHYDFKKHALNSLWSRTFDKKDLDDMFGYAWAKRASVVIVMTGVFNRTIEKYGERGYRFVLIEAGHIGQNISLSASGLGVKCCALGGVNERYFETLIDVDSQQESVIYSLVLGS